MRRQQLARQRGVDVYDVLTAEAAEAAAGSGNLVFLPYLMGERAPVWDSAARGTLFGLTLHTQRADVIRAILEGVAFGVYHNVQEAARWACNSVGSWRWAEATADCGSGSWPRC